MLCKDCGEYIKWKIGAYWVELTGVTVYDFSPAQDDPSQKREEKLFCNLNCVKHYLNNLNTLE